MATQLDDDRSLGQLVGEATRDLGELVRQEIALAKTETKEELRGAAKAGAMFGVGGLAALEALMLLLFAAAWGLAEVMPVGVAFLIVGLVLAAVATIAVLEGRKRMQGVTPVPEQTVETIKEDVQWFKARKS